MEALEASERKNMEEMKRMVLTTIQELKQRSSTASVSNKPNIDTATRAFGNETF